MSTFKPGDRVRITLDATVGDGFYCIAGPTDLARGWVDRLAVSVELTQAWLPTAPGSVIRVGSILYGKGSDQRWHPLMQGGMSLSPEANCADREVIFDAGAAR